MDEVQLTIVGAAMGSALEPPCEEAGEVCFHGCGGAPERAQRGLETVWNLDMRRVAQVGCGTGEMHERGRVKMDGGRSWPERRNYSGIQVG